EQRAVLDTAECLCVHLEGPEGGQRFGESPARRVAVAARRVDASKPPPRDRLVSLVLGDPADLERTRESLARGRQVVGPERELSQMALAFGFKLLVPDVACDREASLEVVAC